MILNEKLEYEPSENAYTVILSVRTVHFILMRTVRIAKNNYLHHWQQISGERLQDHWSSGLMFNPALEYSALGLEVTELDWTPIQEVWVKTPLVPVYFRSTLANHSIKLNYLSRYKTCLSIMIFMSFRLNPVSLCGHFISHSS